MNPTSSKVTGKGTFSRSKLFSSLLKGLALVAAFNFGKKYLTDRSKPSIDADVIYKPAWNIGERARLYIYVSSQPIQTRFVRSELYFDEPFTYGDKSANFRTADNKRIEKPDDPNSRLYAHIYACRFGAHPNPDISGYRPLDVAYKRVTLTRMSADGALFWYPQMKLSIVPYEKDIDVMSVPLPLRPHISIDRSTKTYLPIIYSQENWQLKSKRKQIGSENALLQLEVGIDTKAYLLFQIMALVGEAIERASGNSALLSEELEQLKEMFTETATWYLVVTFTVALLHSLFDFLAFKNDVQFWSDRQRRKSLHGLSLRSIIFNVLSQTVILLYLINQGSSWLIVGSSAIALFIEVWKFSGVVERNGWAVLKIKQFDRSTDQFDLEAIKYLSLVMIPLMSGYSVYSWMFNTSKVDSMYSFALKTAVSFVYAFGFITMTPQLYINYRLKSVAHLPWRCFTYKALNTIVDDLFAFAIKMPLLHRISCFRDDILFLVFLYQKWIYPVDMSRTNEYGESFEASSASNKNSKKKD